MAAISNLCGRAIQLTAGSLVRTGNSKLVVDEYFREIHTAPTSNSTKADIPSTSGVALSAISSALNQSTNPLIVRCGEDATIRFEFDSDRKIADVVLSAWIDTKDGARVTTIHNITAGVQLNIVPGHNVIDCLIADLPLSPNEYVFSVKLRTSSYETLVMAHDCAFLRVCEGDFFGTGKVSNPSWSGTVFLHQKWMQVASPDKSINSRGALSRPL